MEGGKLDRRVSPLTAGDVEMEMGLAMEMYRVKLESPGILGKIKGGKTGGRGRKRSMQNQ